MNPRFFLREGIRSMRANSAIALAATITVLLTLSILGAVLVSYQYISSALDHQTNRLDIRASLRFDVTPDQQAAFEQRMKATPHVESVKYVSPADGLEELKKTLKDPKLLEGVASNPLPPELRATPDDANNAQSIINALKGDPALLVCKPVTGVTDAACKADTGMTYGGESAATLIRIRNWIKWVGLIMVIGLVLSSIFLIANTIQLSMFARRREVEVMKLVGATNWFIRWPFIIEGILCGVAGALLAVTFLWITKATLIQDLAGLGKGLTRDDATTMSFPALALSLIGAGALVGALGSGFTLRRFLRV